MFRKEDRCERCVVLIPPIEIGGYKMLDVFDIKKINLINKNT